MLDVVVDAGRIPVFTVHIVLNHYAVVVQTRQEISQQDETTCLLAQYAQRRSLNPKCPLVIC